MALAGRSSYLKIRVAIRGKSKHTKFLMMYLVWVGTGDKR
jgi:hypothetical protein